MFHSLSCDLSINYTMRPLFGGVPEYGLKLPEGRFLSRSPVSMTGLPPDKSRDSSGEELIWAGRLSSSLRYDVVVKCK